MTLAPSTSDLSKCPRCGYDLRGALANWTDACPLDGTCTECGLHFDWAHVLRPEKFAPAWCVEFVPRWGFPWACVSTFGRSFRPWRFWRALKMSMKIHRLRLLVYVATLLLPVILAYASLQTVAALRMRYYRIQRQDWDAIGTSLGVVLLGLWIWLLLPVSFVLLPVSRRRAKVRWAHFLRISAYAVVVPSAVITVSLLALTAGLSTNRLRDEMFGLAHLLPRYAMIPLLLAFWAVAIKRYLHIPHNWAVVFLLSIVVVLVLGFAVWFVVVFLLGVFELVGPRW